MEIKVPGLVALLGENNVQRLQDEITELMISQIQEDMREVYLFNFNELIEDIEKEVRADLRAKVAARYKVMVDQYVDKMFPMDSPQDTEAPFFGKFYKTTC